MDILRSTTAGGTPIWQIYLREQAAWHRPEFDTWGLLQRLDAELLGCGFRAASIGRLPCVLRTGIDVEPPESVIYVDDFEKAWEYGDWPKLILALDWGCLKRTFLEVPANTPSDELEHLRGAYPTELLSRDGSAIWFSRLRKDDPRLASPYEIAYARWIPEDAGAALRGVLIFYRPVDRQVEAAHGGPPDGSDARRNLGS